jgi:hypothetical protein
MPYVLDGLLVVLGAALVIAVYILFKITRRRAYSRHGGNVFPLYRLRYRFRGLARQAVPILLLIVGASALLWWEKGPPTRSLTGSKPPSI